MFCTYDSSELMKMPEQAGILSDDVYDVLSSDLSDVHVCAATEKSRMCDSSHQSINHVGTYGEITAFH